MGSRSFRCLMVVAMLLLGCWLPTSRAVNAQTEIDFSKPDAFPTVATGLLPAVTDDRNVAVGRIDLTAGEVHPDSVPGLPGFVIIILGTVVVSAEGIGPVAVLQVGDAFWLDEGTIFQFAPLLDYPETATGPIDKDASIWRVAIGPDVRGDSVSPTDPYTFILSSLGGDTVPDGGVRAYSVRAALLPDGADLSLGMDGETLAYIFAVSGTVSLDNDPSKTISDGEYRSPFFNDLTVSGGDAYVLYLVEGPIVPPNPNVTTFTNSATPGANDGDCPSAGATSVPVPVPGLKATCPA